MSDAIEFQNIQRYLNTKMWQFHSKKRNIQSMTDSTSLDTHVVPVQRLTLLPLIRLNLDRQEQMLVNGASYNPAISLYLTGSSSKLPSGICNKREMAGFDPGPWNIFVLVMVQS